MTSSPSCSRSAVTATGRRILRRLPIPGQATGRWTWRAGRVISPSKSLGTGPQVIGLDLTARMIEVAQSKGGTDRARVLFLVGDMMTLPFPDGLFDLVTTGYGIRNVPIVDIALCEIYRVLKPGGRLLSLDFDRPAHPVVRTIYLAYLTVVGSALGLVLHRNPDTYRYIPESLRRYPGAPGVAAAMRRLGFLDVSYIPLLGGLMAINRGSK